MKGFIVLVAMVATSLSAHADLYCRWDPTGAPSSFLRVHTGANTNSLGTAYSITGWNPKTQSGYRTNYREVKIQKSGHVFTIVVNGDVPLVQGAITGSGTLWFDQNEVTYPMEAYWNAKIPGGPTRQALRGVCWTDRVQKKAWTQEHPVARP